MTYRNPIIPGFHPDPSVCRVGSYFYLVTSSFQYFPGIPIFRSTNLVDWELIGHCITRTLQVDLRSVPDSGGIWAPTIRHANGRFFVTATLVHKANFTNALDANMHHTGFDMVTRHFIVSAADPAGEWSDPIWIDGPGFDPSLYFLEDDRAYFTFSSSGTILQGEIDTRTGHYVRSPEPIWSGTAEVDTEGPHLYRIGSYWYLVVAEGGTSYDHSVAVARSESAWGPWESCPQNPVVSSRTDSGGPIQATGHAELFDDANGDWWMVVLGVRPVGYPRFHTLGRETFLLPVSWVEGWPVVEPAQPTMNVDRPMVDSPPPKTEQSIDRGPTHNVSTLCSLREPSGFVPVEGNQLEVVHPPSAAGAALSFLGDRQRDHYATADVTVEFISAEEGASIGLAAYMDNAHSYWIGVTRDDGRDHVVVDFTVRGLRHREVLGETRLGAVSLRIEATPFAYTLSWRKPGDNAAAISRSAHAMSLSSEVAGGFTGVFLALIAEGCQSSVARGFETRSVPRPLPASNRAAPSPHLEPQETPHAEH